MQNTEPGPYSREADEARAPQVKIAPNGSLELGLDPATRKRGIQVALLAALERSQLDPDTQLAIVYNLAVTILSTMPAARSKRGKLINAAVQDYHRHLQKFLPPGVASTPAPGTPRLG